MLIIFYTHFYDYNTGRPMDCNFAWAALHRTSHHWCVSFTQHRHWTFLIKLINNMLPTASILEERFGAIFRNWTCPLCNLQHDQISHLFTCSSLQHLWQKFFDKLLISLRKFADKHKLTSNCSTLLDSLLPRFNDDSHFIQINFTN